VFKPNVIGICSGVGFALSLITGLISGNSFGHCILMALVYAVVFAVLCVAVSFIYQKFLSTGQSESASSQDVSQEPVKGQNVDITLDDDNLPDEDGPKFFVNNPQMAKQSQSELAAEPASTVSEPVRQVPPESEPGVSVMTDENVNKDAELDELPSEPKSADAGNSTGFVPVNLGANAEKVTENKSSSTGDSFDNLDELPDVGSLSLDGEKKDSENDDVISDSDFASAGSPPPSGPSFPDGKQAGEQNTAVMAEAIRTILAKQDN